MTDEEEAEKASIWLMGQKLTKTKFNKKAYERNKMEAEREELERRIEEEGQNP